MIASDIGLDDLSLGYNASMDSCSLILGRRVTGGGGDLPSSLALVVNRATNRLGGDGYFHDVLGNLVQMPAGVDFVTMSYLDQGHIGTLTDAAGVVWKYYYDADGKRRIKVKTTGGAATEPDGQGGVRLVADRSFYFYEGEDLICQQDVGALVARIPGTDDIDESVYGPKFLLLDHLGSTRAELVFTESGGVFSPVIQEYYDLMPYGEVITPPSTQESVLFTSKSRDTESGLDFFGARYTGSSLFRWTSPDQPLSDERVEDPQSLNKYIYCRNNPVIAIDPDGRATYVVVWATAEGRYGHAGIAVSNYSADANGKMVADGTLTYYDCWPGRGVGQSNFNQNVDAVYNNLLLISEKALSLGDASRGENYSPDGVLKLETSYEQDQAVLKTLEQYQADHSQYNGVTANCSTYVQAGVEATTGTTIKAQEDIGKYKAVTPNKLYQSTAQLKHAKVLKDPGDKVKTPFLEGAANGAKKAKLIEEVVK